MVTNYMWAEDGGPQGLLAFSAGGEEKDVRFRIRPTCDIGIVPFLFVCFNAVLTQF